MKRRDEPEFAAWRGMRHRCNSPKNSAWKNYGGRGIKVCERWQSSYEAFLADVGRRPSPTHSLDRIDVNGNYEPDNVRWATRDEQSQNQRRRITIEQARRVKRLLSFGFDRDIVAAFTGVSLPSVSHIALGLTWKNVDWDSRANEIIRRARAR